MRHRIKPELDTLPMPVPLFEFLLEPAVNRQIAAIIKPVNVDRGQILAREGSSGETLFVLVKGAVKLSKALGGDRRQIVAFRGAGDIVGLHRCHTPWPVTVEALTETRALLLPWDRLRPLALRHPQIERVLLDLAGDEIASLQDHLLTLGRKTTEEKIASFLLSFVRSNGLQSPTRREVHLPMRRIDIADYLGLTMASVSRELTRLKRENIVSLPRPSRVVLLDQTRLEAIAAGSAPNGAWRGERKSLSA